MVAHRGASASHPENTVEAFEAAIQAGADAVEFDVRITADGHAVVMHDADVDRTTDGSGVVRAMDLEDLRALRIRGASQEAAAVPTLEETLSLCAGRVAVDVEVKNTPGEPDFDGNDQAAAQAAVEALDAAPFTGPAMVTSFNPWAIGWVREHAPEIVTGLLTDPSVEADVALGFAREQGHPWVLPWSNRVAEAGPEYPGRVHAAGLSLGTWVVDDPGHAVSLMRAGVDAVATNDPAAVVARRREVLGS